MIVYRVCKENEINEIIKNKDFSYIGCNLNNTNLNNHNYEKNQLYLHFFPDKDDIFYLRTLKNRYICTYDIPEEVLEKYKGNGYYWDFLYFHGISIVSEYSIKNTDISFEYLIKIEYIKDGINIGDYIEDHSLSTHVQPIYRQPKKVKMLTKYKQ